MDGQLSDLVSLADELNRAAAELLIADERLSVGETYDVAITALTGRSMLFVRAAMRGQHPTTSLN